MVRAEPLPAADERAMLMGFLDYYRETMCLKVEGLSDEQGRFKPTPASNPLVGLLNHLGWVERQWFWNAFAGQEIGRNRGPTEFDPQDMTLAEALTFYRGTWERSDEIVAGASLDDTVRRWDGVDVSLRWIVLHVIEETCRHAGHADITRELIDGSTGV